MLKFDDKTGLLLGKNSSSSQNDFKNNSNDKRKILNYEKKINENLSNIAKELGAKKDKKNNLDENTTTASEKANKQKEDINKEIIKQNSNSNNISIDEAGEVLGDAYYRSFEEIRNAISPLSSVFKNLKSVLTKKDKPKTAVKENIKSVLTKKDKPKTASEKARHTEKKVNLDEKILQKEDDVLDINKEILKSVKKISKKPNGSIGIAKILLQSLSKFLPLLGIIGAIKSLGISLKRLIKIPKNSSKKTSARKNELKKQKKETDKDKTKNASSEKNKDIKEKQKISRKKTKKPSRYKRVTKIAFKKSKKIGAKAVAKIGAKVGSKFIPVVGEVLLAWDGVNIVKKMSEGLTLVEATKSQMLGIDPEKKVNMNKSETFISENKKDIVSRRTHTENTKKTIGDKSISQTQSIEINYKDDFNRVVNAINLTSKETNIILAEILKDIGNETIVYNPKRDKVNL